MTLQFGVSNGDDHVSNLSTRFGVEPWDVEVGNRRDIQEIEVLEYRVLLGNRYSGYKHAEGGELEIRVTWDGCGAG